MYPEEEMMVVDLKIKALVPKKAEFLHIVVELPPLEDKKEQFAKRIFKNRLDDFDPPSYN